MASNNVNASVTLSLIDLTQDRIKSLRSDIEALSKVRSATAVDGASRAQAQGLTLQAQALKDAERGWHGVNAEATKAKATLSGLGEAAAGFGRSAVGGVGLGSVGSLLTAGGIGAAVAAVGAITGQSIKMAYEFERASTRAAQALSVGTGPNLQANITALKSASAQGLAYNFSRPEMVAAMATYGMASGSGVRQTTAAASGIAMYSRAYNLDPQQTAQIVGTVTAMTGKGFDSEASGMFGAAESAGNLGRRLPEFLSVATSTLAQLQASNARGDYTGSDAAALIANVSRGQTGFYGTAAGAQSYFGAGKSLISGSSASPGREAFAINAGIKPLDVVLERGGPENERKAVLEIGKLSGGGKNEWNAIQVMANMGLSPDTMRHTLDRMNYKNGVLQGPSWEAQTNKLYSTKAPISPDGEKALAKERADQYKSTEIGQFETLFTDIQDKELALGQHILDGLAGTAKSLDKLINGDFKNAAIGLEIAIAANTLVQLGLNPLKLLKGKGGVGLLTRGAAGVGEVLAGAEGAVEGAGAVGAGAAAAGGVGLAAPLIGGGVALGAAWTGFYHLLGGARMGQAHDIGVLASGGLSDDAARSLIMGGSGGSRSLFSAAQNASLQTASAKYGVPMALLAGLTLQEHGGAVSNADQVGGGGRGWFQIDTGSHMGWLRKHHMGHDFGSAAEYAASMVADTWKNTHSVDAVGEFYNGGHVGAKTTVNDRGTYEQGLAAATNQAVADGVGSTNIPDGMGGTVAVVVRATHHPAKKPHTQSIVKNR